MVHLYSYIKSGIKSGQLKKDINNSSVSISVHHIEVNGELTDVFMTSELSEEESVQLNLIVQSFTTHQIENENIKAEDIELNTSNFENLLTNDENNVQLAIEKLEKSEFANSSSSSSSSSSNSNPICGGMSILRAFKDSTQNLTKSYEDIKGWVSTCGDSFLFNETTGEITFLKNSNYMITVDTLITGGNSRVQHELKCMEDNGYGYTDNPKLIWKNYSSRNNTQKYGTTTGSFLSPYSNGDKIKFQSKYVGSSSKIEPNNARIYIVDLSL